MTNPKCGVCGHVNRVGTAVCEMCDTRFDAAGGARDASHGAGGETYGDAAGSAYAGSGDEGAAFPGEERRDGGLPTDIPSPQFKGAGDVISPTLEIYRKHFLLVGLLVLVTTLPLVLLHYWFYVAIYSGELEGPAGGSIGAAAVGAGIGGTLFYWILTALGNALLSGALAYAVVQIQRTGAAGAGASLTWGLTKLPKVVAVTLLSYLVMYGAPALVTGLLVLTLGPAAFLVVLLLILPWVVVTLMFSLVVPAAAVENRGVIESLTRSVELTKGNKGLIFLTYFLWSILTGVLNLLVSWSFYYGGSGSGPDVSFVALLVQMLVSGMLNSSMYVLTVYIFLGILNENRQGFAAHAYTPDPRSAAR